MDPKTIGIISGLIVGMNAIPYGIRTYQRKIRPNLTSWGLWTFIGFVLLLTYKSSGAGANVMPAIFGFINPLLITIIILLRRGAWTRPSRLEIVCIVISIFSLSLWFLSHKNKELSQYALYFAIVADSFAAIPTFAFVWTTPDGDRPLAWIFFAIGYGIAIFAITEHTFANYVLPIYMFLGALGIAYPLARYQLRKKSSLSEWI